MFAGSLAEYYTQVANEQNHYPFYLAAVNNVAGVLAKEDICTIDGFTIVHKGHPVTYPLAEMLSRHALAKPLEGSIYVSCSIKPKTLKIYFDEFISSFHDVETIHNAHDFNGILEDLICSSSIKPILLQELTILQRCFPDLFEKTLFCAWLSSLIAHKLKADGKMMEDVFLSGLTHDIGFLHIPENIFAESSFLTPKRRFAIQSHVVLGNNFLKNIYGNNSTVAGAVLDHHERYDGSGYPLGKGSEHISPEAQIVGTADMIKAVRIGRFEQCGRSLRDISPFLEINSGKISKEIRDAVFSILKHSNISDSNGIQREDLKTLIDRLVFHESRLRRSIEHIDGIKKSLELTVSFSGEKISKLIAPVDEMVRLSGITSGNNLDWLFSLQKNPSNASRDKLQEISLMQGELRWQIDELCKTINQEVFASLNVDTHMERVFYLSNKISWLLSND